MPDTPAGTAARLLGRFRRQRANLAPVDHDYGPGHRCWGHDYTVTRVIDGGKRLEAAGWGKGLRKGQTVALTNKANADGRSVYVIESVSYFSDPDDMWSATLRHDGRPRPRVESNRAMTGSDYIA